MNGDSAPLVRHCALSNTDCLLLFKQKRQQTPVHYYVARFLECADVGVGADLVIAHITRGIDRTVFAHLRVGWKKGGIVPLSSPNMRTSQYVFVREFRSGVRMSTGRMPICITMDDCLQSVPPTPRTLALRVGD